ncbi:helix-turn-helix domain-containing transcriptional regulator [Pseudomonas oryzihabitans]|uniref:helix-turn-helix domain-containing transcriptional regulator n=1 Tax=Pseudomonas oryzihabitans TaxID=47885 RepID=UPI00289A6EFF|nr:transcriptional regulator [Pseudomonas oryzihabitans]
MASHREVLRQWDVADHLKTEEDIALYIEAAEQEAPGDEDFMAKVMKEVERARRIKE